MGDKSNSFNAYSTLHVVRAETPELLAKKIRDADVRSLRIESFNQNDQGAYAYYTVLLGNLPKALKELS